MPKSSKSPKSPKKIAAALKGHLKGQYTRLTKEGGGSDFYKRCQEYVDRLLANLRSSGIERDATLSLLENNEDICAEFFRRCRVDAALFNSNSRFGTLFLTHLLDSLAQAEDTSAYISAKTYLKDDAIFERFFTLLAQPACLGKQGVVNLLIRPARGPGDKKGDPQEPVHLGHKLVAKIMASVQGEKINTVTASQRDFALGVFEIVLRERFKYVAIPNDGIKVIHYAAWYRARILGERGNWQQAIEGYEEVMSWMGRYVAYNKISLPEGMSSIVDAAREGVARLDRISQAAGNPPYTVRYSQAQPVPLSFMQGLQEQFLHVRREIATTVGLGKRKRQGEDSEEDDQDLGALERRKKSREGTPSAFSPPVSNSSPSRFSSLSSTMALALPNGHAAASFVSPQESKSLNPAALPVEVKKHIRQLALWERRETASNLSVAEDTVASCEAELTVIMYLLMVKNDMVNPDGSGLSWDWKQYFLEERELVDPSLVMRFSQYYLRETIIESGASVMGPDCQSRSDQMRRAWKYLCRMHSMKDESRYVASEVQNVFPPLSVSSAAFGSSSGPILSNGLGSSAAFFGPPTPQPIPAKTVGKKPVVPSRTFAPVSDE